MPETHDDAPINGRRLAWRVDLLEQAEKSSQRKYDDLKKEVDDTKDLVTELNRFLSGDRARGDIGELGRISEALKANATAVAALPGKFRDEIQAQQIATRNAGAWSAWSGLKKTVVGAIVSIIVGVAVWMIVLLIEISSSHLTQAHP